MSGKAKVVTTQDCGHQGASILYHGKIYCSSCHLKQLRVDYYPKPGETVTTGLHCTKPRGARNLGIGALAKKCIAAGKSYEETHAEIVKHVPTSKFSRACYSWYKGKLQKGKSNAK